MKVACCILHFIVVHQECHNLIDFVSCKGLYNGINVVYTTIIKSLTLSDGDYSGRFNVLVGPNKLGHYNVLDIL